jgi:hypothetical protein
MTKEESAAGLREKARILEECALRVRIRAEELAKEFEKRATDFRSMAAATLQTYCGPPAGHMQESGTNHCYCGSLLFDGNVISLKKRE